MEDKKILDVYKIHNENRRKYYNKFSPSECMCGNDEFYVYKNIPNTITVNSLKKILNKDEFNDLQKDLLISKSKYKTYGGVNIKKIRERTIVGSCTRCSYSYLIEEPTIATVSIDSKGNINHL